MLIRAILVFASCILLGAVGVPLIMWATAGFPNSDSHGLWIPLTVGLYMGVAGGFIVGLLVAIISLVCSVDGGRESEEKKKD